MKLAAREAANAMSLRTLNLQKLVARFLWVDPSSDTTLSEWIPPRRHSGVGRSPSARWLREGSSACEWMA